AVLAMKGRDFDITKRIAAIAERFREILNRKPAAPPGGPEGVWLNSAEVRALFRISARSLDHWKNQGLLRGRRFGNRNYFSLAEVILLIQDIQRPSPKEAFSFKDLVLLDTNNLYADLKISARTEFRWREKFLPCSRISGRIYYSLADISNELERKKQQSPSEADVGEMSRV